MSNLPAREVHRLMGMGMRLVVARDGSHPRLVRDPRLDLSPTPEADVPLAVVRELASSGSITKLTKHRQGSRLGWFEMGLDGEEADIYVCTQ